MISMLIVSFDAVSLGIGLAVLIAGWVVMFATLRGWMRGQIESLRTGLEERIRQELQSRSAAEPQTSKAPAPVAAPVSAAKPAPAPAATPAPAKPVAAAASVEVTPEILAVITAAVSQFLGVNVRIRSARMAAAAPTVGSLAWAQQGRVQIQASHNLMARRSHA